MSIVWWIVILGAAAFVLISLIVGYVFSQVVLRSRRQPVVRTPAEYGLAYEQVEFTSTDNLTLKGWFVPGREPDKVVILTHPMPFNRHGFIARNQGLLRLFRTDVDLLRTVQALNRAGYSVLTFDFRNHGESARGITGVGLTEYQDVLGAVAYIKQRCAPQEPQIGFVSFCMGANSTMVALSKGKDQVSNVRFLVAIQPISAEVFFRSYLKSVYTPLSLYLIPLVDRLTQWQGGYALADMSPLKYAPDIEIPVLYVQAREDPWTELSDIQAFYEATTGPKEFWWIEGKMRRFNAYNHVGEHPERVLTFAKTHFSD
jgi:alpha-beta hydrolase superfamily lysophospholipase